MPLQVNDMWGSYESMTCGVNGIYLNFGFFNGMHPIIPKCFCFCFYFYFFFEATCCCLLWFSRDRNMLLS
jgi:hypothetical protein